MEDYSIAIDGDSMTYGDYLDLVDGSPSQQADVFSGFVVDGVGDLVGKEQGLLFLRSLKMSQLSDLMETAKTAVIGENSPN